MRKSLIAGSILFLAFCRANMARAELRVTSCQDILNSAPTERQSGLLNLAADYAAVHLKIHRIIVSEQDQKLKLAEMGNLTHQLLIQEDGFGARLVLVAARQINPDAWFVPAYTWYASYLEDSERTEGRDDGDLTEIWQDAANIYNQVLGQLSSELNVLSRNPGADIEIHYGPAALGLLTNVITEIINKHNLSQEDMNFAKTLLSGQIYNNEQIISLLKNLGGHAKRLSNADGLSPDEDLALVRKFNREALGLMDEAPSGLVH